MQIALVTGCAGFIGSHLVEKLLELKWNVVGIDNFHPYYDKKIKLKNISNFKNHKNFKFIEGSILNLNDLKKCDNFDTIFHLAGIAGVRNSFENPEEYFQINVKGTENLLKIFPDVEKFIFASSSSVYGEVLKNDFPVKEDHTLNPISPYGQSKKLAEEKCKEFFQKNSSKISILRFYTVYGPRQRPDEAIMKFINLASEGKPVPIFGDGTKIRDFTYVSDIIDGLVLAHKYGNGTYNLGSSNPVSVNEMVDIIETNLDSKILRDYISAPKGDVQKTHADISKAKKELKFEPKIDFKHGILKTIEWFKMTQEC